MAALILRTTLELMEGQEAAFLKVATRWASAARDEAGTVAFDVFRDTTTAAALFLEQYADSDAFMVHREALDPDLRKELYGTCVFKGLEVYGTVSEQVRLALAPSGAAFLENVAP